MLDNILKFTFYAAFGSIIICSIDCSRQAVAAPFINICFVIKVKLIKTQHTNSSFASPSPQADASAYKRAILPNTLFEMLPNIDLIC